MSKCKMSFSNSLSFPLEWKGFEFISRNFENFENEVDAFNTNSTRG